VAVKKATDSGEETAGALGRKRQEPVQNCLLPSVTATAAEESAGKQSNCRAAVSPRPTGKTWSTRAR
jgi:hypothetical protein